MQNEEFLKANQRAWDVWTDDHLKRAAYSLETLRQGGSSLTPVDLEELTEVNGKSLLHLMCHLGTDTLSWARQGARVTGLDFSAKSIAAARSLAAELKLPASFVQCDVYEAAQCLNERFDIVYTSAGVICWLPDVPAWAKMIASLLKPGGVFYLREIHPVFWSLAQDRNDSLLVIDEAYFEGHEPQRDEESVVGKSSVQTTFGWSHSLGEIISALISAGLRIEFLHEHRTGGDWSWMLDMQQRDDGRWELREGRDRLPLEYSIRAVLDV